MASASVPGRRGTWLGRTVLWLIMASVAAVFAAPLALMVLASAQPDERSGLADVRGGEQGGDGVGGAIGLLSSAANNYGRVLRDPAVDMPGALRNSLRVALLSVAGMTISSAVVAYGFARLRWPGREACFAVVLATMMIPFPVIMAPTYLVFKQLGMIGTLMPLWLPSWFGGAFSIYLLRQFFTSIPRELDEAAKLDGCTEFGVFLRIVIPTSVPALAVVALLQFVSSWNDFLGPLLFLNHQETYTLALALHMFQSQHGGVGWNLTMAATALTIAPVVAVFVFAHRAITDGIGTQGMVE